MSLTIILSGPKVSLSQARNALAAEGFDVQATDHEHGLPPFATEDEATSEPQAFVTVLGDDIDKAHAAVRPLGWRLRMHLSHVHELASPVQQATDNLASLEARLAALEATLGR